MRRARKLTGETIIIIFTFFLPLPVSVPTEQTYVAGAVLQLKEVD